MNGLVKAAGIYFLPKLLEKTGISPQQVQSVTSTANTYAFELSPHNRLDSKQLEQSAEIIRDRLNSIGGNYTVETTDDKILMQIDEDMLSDNGTENTAIMRIITSEGVFIPTMGYTTADFDKDELDDISIESGQKKKVYNSFKNQLDAITAHDYSRISDTLDAIEDDEEIYYIHANLSSKTAREFKECIDDFNGQSEYGKSTHVRTDSDLYDSKSYAG